MTYYKYLGYGVTNSEGVAHLDHDADGEPIDHSYTGVGAGEIDVLASLDNPIVEGSIVSVPCNVLDCYKYDEGLLAEGHHNDIWTGIIPLTDYRIECDVYQVDGTQDEWFITVLDENYTSIRSADSKLGEWKHISLDLTNIASNSRVRLNTGGSCTELRFKNFKLYPI